MSSEEHDLLPGTYLGGGLFAGHRQGSTIVLRLLDADGNAVHERGICSDDLLGIGVVEFEGRVFTHELDPESLRGGVSVFKERKTMVLK